MRRHAGFTLVELIIVIILLAIVATISVQFVALSTSGAIDVGARQQRALQGVVIGEQMTRELRSAFPLSVRTSGPCIEWIPIAAGTSYTELTKGPDFDRVSVAPLSNVPAIGGIRAVVYGYGTPVSSLYGDSDPGPVSSEISAIDNGSSPAVITLSDSHRFGRQSPEKRLFIIGDPVSLCQSGRFLYRYSGYTRDTTQPVPPTDGSSAVLASNLQGDVDFRFTPATFRRAAVVQFTFTLEDRQGEETTTVSQEVQIRNVP